MRPPVLNETATELGVAGIVLGEIGDLTGVVPAVDSVGFHNDQPGLRLIDVHAGRCSFGSAVVLSHTDQVRASAPQLIPSESPPEVGAIPSCGKHANRALDATSEIIHSQ